MEMAANGMIVAMLATNGVEESLLMQASDALEAEGAVPRIISDRPGLHASSANGQPASEIKVELLLDKADAKSFDALLLLGGDINRMTQEDREEAQRFLQNFAEDAKPIGAISGGTALLAAAGMAAQGSSDAAENSPVSHGNVVIGQADADAGTFLAQFIDTIAARMQANLQGKADGNAVGIAGS